jgi:chromosome partitioning protein
VLSSTIDVHAALDFFKEMQLKTKIQHTDQRVAIIANRIHHRSHLPLNLQPLRQLINSLGIKFIATLRDSENYLKAYEQGLGIFELEGRTIKKDIDCWCSLLTWLETRAEISKQKEHQEHR